MPSILAARGLRAAQVADVLVGAGPPEKAIIDLIGSARGPIWQELHTFTSPGAQEALARALDQHATAHVLTSPRVRLPDSPNAWDTPLARVARHGDLQATHYGKGALPGGHDAYLHSKLIAVEHGDRVDAAFTNVSLTVDSAERPDVAVLLSGDTARAARDVIVAAEDGSPRAIAESADAARGTGLLMDDPIGNVHHLTDAYDSLVAGATERLVLVAKGLDDPQLAHALVAAHRRGVAVSVSLRDLVPESADILEAGGVRTILQPEQPSSRLNMLIADDAAMVATAYPASWMLGRGAPSTSRESAVLIDGAQLRVLERRLMDVPEAAEALRPVMAELRAGRATGMRRFGREARRAAAALAAPPAPGFMPIDLARHSGRLVSELE